MKNEGEKGSNKLNQSVVWIDSFSESVHLKMYFNALCSVHTVHRSREQNINDKKNENKMECWETGIAKITLQVYYNQPEKKRTETFEMLEFLLTKFSLRLSA